MRVESDGGGGKLGDDGVMVGDDDVHPGGQGGLDFGDGVGSAVGGDQQVDALGGNGGDGGLVEPVAFAAAVREVGGRVESQGVQRQGQDGATGDAVGVVVGVNTDPLAGGDGPQQARGGGLHAVHQEGVVGRQTAGDEFTDGVGVAQAAIVQQLDSQRGEVGDGAKVFGRQPWRDPPAATAEAQSLRVIQMPAVLPLVCRGF